MSKDDVHDVLKFEHPGTGRRRGRATPKGRQIDPEAAHEIAVLLGDRPRRRDLLIEHFRLIQDTYGQLAAAHLAALADEMRLAFVEVFETATFYAHFDVVNELGVVPEHAEIRDLDVGPPQQTMKHEAIGVIDPARMQLLAGRGDLVTRREDRRLQTPPHLQPGKAERHSETYVFGAQQSSLLRSDRALGDILPL